MNTLRIRAFLGRNHIRLAAVAVGLYWLTGCTVRGPHAAAQPPGGPDLSYLLLAIIGLSIVGIGACIAGEIWLPFKRACLAGLAGFASMLGVALTVKTIQPYLGYIVLVGFLALLALGAYALWKLVKGGKLAAAYAADAANAETDADLAMVKAGHAAAWAKQNMTGVMAHLGVTL